MEFKFDPQLIEKMEKYEKLRKYRKSFRFKIAQFFIRIWRFLSWWLGKRPFPFPFPLFDAHNSTVVIACIGIVYHYYRFLLPFACANYGKQRLMENKYSGSMVNGVGMFVNLMLLISFYTRNVWHIHPWLLTIPFFISNTIYQLVYSTNEVVQTELIVRLALMFYFTLLVALHYKYANDIYKKSVEFFRKSFIKPRTFEAIRRERRQLALMAKMKVGPYAVKAGTCEYTESVINI